MIHDGIILPSVFYIGRLIGYLRLDKNRAKIFHEVEGLYRELLLSIDPCFT